MHGGLSTRTATKNSVMMSTQRTCVSMYAQEKCKIVQGNVNRHPYEMSRRDYEAIGGFPPLPINVIAPSLVTPSTVTKIHAGPGG
jgi:hypothetical protein